MQVTAKKLALSAGLTGLALALGGCSEPEMPPLPSGDGAWLQISEDSLQHDSTGQARIVIRQGGQENMLSAPYRVTPHGSGGTTITLKTTCGEFPVMVLRNGDTSPIGVSALAADSNSVPNCGLGSGLFRAGAWRFLTKNNSSS